MYPTCKWDTCAGHAILASEGGGMVDKNGDEILYQDETTNWANKLIVAYKDRDILGSLTNIIDLK